MQALGYEMIEQRGLFFDAIYVSYLSEKQQKKSGALLRGLFWGLYSNLKALRMESIRPWFMSSKEKTNLLSY